MDPVEVPSHILQIAYVTIPSYTSHTGEMELLERSKGAGFESIAKFPINIGKSGLGWGPGARPSGAPEKKEGDNRAPAGLFPILSAFGLEKFSTETTLPYTVIKDSHEWVDDPAHYLYNTFVDTSVTPVTWKSSEKLKRSDQLYDLVFVVGYNTSGPIPGAGSAIFIHTERGPGIGSAGCTTMGLNNLLQLAHWLKPEKNPHILQMIK